MTRIRLLFDGARHAMRWLPGVFVGGMVAACSEPAPLPAGTEVRVEMLRMVSEADLAREAGGLTGRLDAWLSPADRERREATGLAAFAAAGRLAVTRCALADFTPLFPMAVLPVGIAPEPRELLRVRLGDASTPDEGLGIVTEPPELERATVARLWEPSLGAPPLSAVPMERMPDAFVRQQYHRVQGGWLVRCVPPA